MLAAPVPVAAFTAPTKRQRPGASVIVAIAAVIAITLCAAAYYFLL